MSSEQAEPETFPVAHGGQRPGPERRADLEARVALAALPKLGPARSRWLLANNEPARVVADLRAGRLPTELEPAPPGVTSKLVEGWRAALASLDGAQLLNRQLAGGRTVLTPADDRWPFGDDPDPPVLLFCWGDVDLLAERRTVAVVGTRRCTSIGRSVAHRLGHDLVRFGVSVVSGLALGIDAAAHLGSLDGGGAPIGVVATGLDVIYPGANRQLWTRVVEHGVLVSEAPAGTRAERWRFPARNRLIAALGAAVVIVESHQRGGSLITAEEAAERGRPVFAVPGSVVSPAADGTNALLVDGAYPARCARDVVELLGFVDVGDQSLESSAQAAQSVRPSGARSPASGRDGLRDRLAAEAAAGPCSVEQLVLALGVGPVEVLAAIQALVADGVVRFDGAVVAACGHMEPDSVGA